MQHSTLWGVDLGGSKIECVVLESASNPTVIQRTRIETEGDQGYDHVLSRIRNLVKQISQQTGLTPENIGIGTPGSLDPESNLLRGSNSRYLLNKPLATDLENTLGIPVIIENDANCFTLAEAYMGVVPLLKPDPVVVFGVILGTGVGGGLVINRKLISGCNMITGEWGHNYLDKSGGQCYCGKTGCVETVISGPALEKFYHAQSGSRKSLANIVNAVGKGDAHADATIDRLIYYFGLGISGIINIIDPDVIVLGGGVGNIEALYTAGVNAARHSVFSPTVKTRIVKPALGDSAGVFGAAFLNAQGAFSIT